MPENDEPKASPQPQPHPQSPPPLDINIDLAGIDAPASVSEDRQARKEQTQVFGDQRRSEEIKETIHTVLVVSMRWSLMLFLAVFAVRVFHFILPDNNAANAGSWYPHGWLTELQLGSIDKFATGALGIIVAQFARRFITEDPGRFRNR